MTQNLTMRDLIQPEAIAVSMAAVTKKDVLQNIAKAAASVMGKDALIIFDILWERERLGTTGVGHGIAIPHGRVPGLDRVCGFFARLAQPVEFEAVDDKPVDLVFLLLAPEAAGADHLHALAIVSRLLRETKLCEQLRRAADPLALYKLLTETSVEEEA